MTRVQKRGRFVEAGELLIPHAHDRPNEAGEFASAERITPHEPAAIPQPSGDLLPVAQGIHMPVGVKPHRRQHAQKWPHRWWLIRLPRGEEGDRLSNLAGPRVIASNVEVDAALCAYCPRDNGGIKTFGGAGEHGAARHLCALGDAHDVRDPR